MKNLVNFTGSIGKTEALLPIKKIILANTSVYEASDPYADYYGRLPHKATPNSLFLLSERFFFLEEILTYSQQLEKCLLDQINIASAILTQNNKHYPAIRIKNFPDYTRLLSVQTCLKEQGVKFSSSILSGLVNARINKVFMLEQVSKDIYFDLVENQKAYLFLDKRMLASEFENISQLIKNSSNCKLFDAVQGEMIIDGNVHEFIRVYAEGLDLDFMQKLQKEFLHALNYTTLKYA